jgi:hypothetical protein
VPHPIAMAMAAITDLVIMVVLSERWPRCR